jgi:hypothetical protein
MAERIARRLRRLGRQPGLYWTANTATLMLLVYLAWVA